MSDLRPHPCIRLQLTLDNRAVGTAARVKGPGSDRYRSPPAHALQWRYVDRWGGEEPPVPVERIARDELGLRVEESRDLPEGCSSMLLPAKRVILVNAEEVTAAPGEQPIRRFRFTIAHELGHWMCHVLGMGGAFATKPTFCRAIDPRLDVDRTLEREANGVAAELLMSEEAVRVLWPMREDPEACAGVRRERACGEVACLQPWAGSGEALVRPSTA